MLREQLKETLMRLYDIRPTTAESIIDIAEMADSVAKREYSRGQKDQIEESIQWTPCSERLPLEQEANYWICTNTGYQCQCRWTRNRYGLGIYDKWGWNLFDIPQYTHVIAWRSLPEPYKEEK